MKSTTINLPVASTTVDTRQQNSTRKGYGTYNRIQDISVGTNVIFFKMTKFLKLTACCNLVAHLDELISSDEVSVKNTDSILEAKQACYVKSWV